MENLSPIPPLFLVFFMISYSMLNVGKPSPWTNALPHDSYDISTKLHTDYDSIQSASNDYGNLVQETPHAVFYPSSIDDIINLIKLSNNRSDPFPIAARGRGHSVRGQAMARDGVVVDMTSLSKQDRVGRTSVIRVSRKNSLGYDYYVDVGGEQLWIDVLYETLKYGLAPVSWTDYLYLTVGGTLSNAGISGQSFLYGPQISNVLELDVITGKGDLITCSKHINSELFFAILGGLGQFGIITRARIVLDKAPTRAKWLRMLYSDFSIFTRDQEHLISLTTNNYGPNYVEGSLITVMSPPNNWRSSFYSPSHHSKISSLMKNNGGLLYSIEIVKYYDELAAATIDQELKQLVKELNFIPGLIFKKDVPLIDFLTRVGSRDNIPNEDGQMETHPWLNLFIPKSRIFDFNEGVFRDIILRQNLTSGPILFYPFNKNKWDDRMSAVIPDEEIFYTLGLLHSSKPDESEIFDKINNEIIEFCEKNEIEIKQYLPYHKSKEDWIKHYGSKWNKIQERKAMFDPKMILSPGQRIFTSIICSDI